MRHFNGRKEERIQKKENIYVGIEESFNMWECFDKVCPKILSTPKTDFKKLVEALVYAVWSRGLSENSCKMKNYFARPKAIEE